MKRFYHLILLCCALEILFFQQSIASAQALASSKGVARESQPRKQRSLKSLLYDLERKHKVYFTFESTALKDKYLQPELKMTDGLEETLQSVLPPFGLQYRKISEKYYTIFPTGPLPTAPLPGAGPVPDPKSSRESNIPTHFGVLPVQPGRAAIQVSGTVRDDQNQPLVGVSVSEKGTTNGATTNAQGEYKVNVQDEKSVLVFSFIGYVSEEVTVGNRTQIDVQLVPDVESLSEVVVVGYGTVKKSDLTGSVSSVSAEDLNKSALTSLDQGLSARAAGVQISTQSGQPGGATSIRIRGNNSINSRNEPLYVIDGFPYYNDNEASQAGIIGGAPALNVLATLNPGDIESVEILKDASAAAIYGSRGANGVILITTKRGKAGTSKVEYDTYYGFQDVIKILPVLNARQYAEFRNDAFVNARGLNGRGKPTYSDEEVASFGEGTNWQEELYRRAPIASHQLSFTGGSEAMQYAVTAGYFDQDGIVLGTGLKRYSMRANLDAKLSNRLKLSNNFTLSYIKSDLARSGGGVNGTSGIQSPTAGNVIQDALFYNPIIPVRDADGNFTSDNNSDTGGSGGGNTANTPHSNPVALQTLATQESFSTRILETMALEYRILEGLKVRVSGGVDLLVNKQNSYLPSTVFIGQTAPNGNAAAGTLLSYSWLNENTLSYDKTFGLHSVNALVGFTAQQFQSDRTITRGRDFPTDLTEVYNIGSANIIDPPSSDYNAWSLLSYLFRVNYGFHSRYLLTLSGRMDGSSRFGPNNKYGFFPSAAFAWRVIDEPFLQNSRIFSDLKLRLSAGVTGNQEIPTYQALSVLGVTRYAVNPTTPVIGLVPNRIGNPDIKWETTTQYNAGVDVGLLGGRLNLTSDVYYKRTTDLLLFVRLPYESGFAQALQNVGAVENKGIELAVNTVNLDGAFRWTTNFNVALNRNKVLDFGTEQERYIGQDYNLFKGQAVGLIRVGEPVGNFVGYVNDGIIRNGEELAAAPKSGFDFVGSRRFRDLNGDGVVNDNDRTIIGNALPDFTGGLQNSFSFKGFQLDALLGFSYGNEVYNMTQLELEFLNGRQNNSATVLDRFIPGVNEDTDVAQAGNPDYVYNRQSHSRWVEDGSFIRLRNLTFAYNIPVTALKLNWLKSARVYFNGQNLWLLSKYRGYDPEVNINPQSNTLLGFDYASYPSAKVYTFGLKAGF